MILSSLSSFFYQNFDQWVIKNKPKEEKQNKIYNQFVNKIKFDSDENFETGIQEVIKNCSKLATGAKILKNLIDTSKDTSSKIIITKGTKTGYHTGTGRIHFNALDQDYYYQTYNENGEVELIKSPLEVIFLHEAIHKINYYIDASAMKKRLKTKSLHSEEMDNQEEELVIRGKIQNGGMNFKYCSENKVLKELGYRERITHLSVVVPKNTTPTICDMIKAKAIGNIRKELKDNLDLINTAEIPEELKQEYLARLPKLDQPPVNSLPDLIILMGFVDAINLFIELGWNPRSEHIQTVERFCEIYNNLLNDLNNSSKKAAHTTTLSKRAITNTLENLEKIHIILSSTVHS